MEFVVALLAVIGLVAVAVRFGPRDASGSVRLPRIVDDSVGMWVLREMTGRPLGRSRDLPGRDDPLARFRRPSTVLAPRVDPRIRLRRTPAVPSPARIVPAVLEDGAPMPPAWSVVVRPPSGREFGTSILDGAPPTQRRRRGRSLVLAARVAFAVTMGLVLGVAAAVATR